MFKTSFRLFVLGAFAALAACSASHELGVPQTASPAVLDAVSSATTGTTYKTKFVQLVIFENEGYGQIVGSPSAPYITSLASQWANMTQSFAITHPSQPNYLALFSGSTQGITGDQCPVNFSVTSLGGQILEKGLTFTGYAESMPSNGFTGCFAVPDNLPSGYLFFRKHVPWPDFSDVPASDNVVYPGPLRAPPSAFTWITPNMCDDMHDCSVSMGDAWAKENLPKLIAWDKAHEGVLILTFDENDGSAGNQITTILAGNVKPGQYAQKITHYNVLRTIEDIFGLKPLLNAKTATPIKNVVK